MLGGGNHIGTISVFATLDVSLCRFPLLGVLYLATCPTSSDVLSIAPIVDWSDIRDMPW